jgi:hypothetical protein
MSPFSGALELLFRPRLVIHHFLLLTFSAAEPFLAASSAVHSFVYTFTPPLCPLFVAGRPQPWLCCIDHLLRHRAVSCRPPCWQMDTVCLSPAPALRCVGLSLTDELITLIPAALEVVFSLGLVFAEGDGGRCVLGLLIRPVRYFNYSFPPYPGFDTSLPQRAQRIFF